MNQLITSSQLTMSSREIASLVKSRHGDIMRSIDRLHAKGVVSGCSPVAYTLESNGQTYYEYQVTKRDTYIVVAQNSPEFTAAIVDRWQELENQQPKIPTNFAEALQLAADQAKQLELAAPKVAFVDNLVTRDNLLNATQVGQPHKMSAKKLNIFLDDFGGVYNKSVKRGRSFCQPWIDKGYGEVKITGSGHNQCLFTTLSEQKINEMLISEGVV